MKFTEEQYLEIIRTYENNSGYDNKTMSIIRVVKNFKDSLSYNEAFALANPVTREWAHEQYVEKEKRYVWNSKKIDRDGYGLRLYKSINGQIETYAALKDGNSISNEQLTESEIREWGYDPERFDREEINE